MPDGSEWYRKSAGDLDMVRRALMADPDANLEGAAYHVQQAAEKLVKGYLTEVGVVWRYSHDIGALANLLPDSDPFKSDLVALDATSSWSTEWRYPEDDPENNTEPSLVDIQTWKQRVEDLSALINPTPSTTAEP